MNRRQALLSAAALLSGRGLAPLPASRAVAGSGRGPCHRQGGLHLRLPARGQLSHPVLVLRGSRQPGVQGVLEYARQQRAGLYARRQGDPDAQFGHALFLCRRRSAGRAAGVHGAGGREGPLLLAAVHRQYTFNFAYVGSRATGNGAGSYLLAGPNWKGHGAQGHQGGDPLRDGIRLRAVPYPAVRSRRHRKREDGSGGLQGADAVGISRPAGARRRARDRLHQTAHRRRGAHVAANSSTS